MNDENTKHSPTTAFIGKGIKFYDAYNNEVGLDVTDFKLTAPVKGVVSAVLTIPLASIHIDRKEDVSEVRLCGRALKGNNVVMLRAIPEEQVEKIRQLMKETYENKQRIELIV